MAIQFDSNSTHISIPPVDIPNGTWSVGVWVRFNSLPAEGDPAAMLFSLLNNEQAGGVDVVRVFVTSAGVLTANIKASLAQTARIAISSEPGFIEPDGQWRLVVLRYSSASGIRLFCGTKGATISQVSTEVFNPVTSRVIDNWYVGAQVVGGTPGNFPPVGTRIGDHFFTYQVMQTAEMQSILDGLPLPNSINYIEPEDVISDFRFESATDLLDRKRGLNATVIGDVSTADHPYALSTGEPPPTEEPALIAPVSGLNPAIRPFNLEWQAVTAATNYHIEFATDAAFTENVKTAKTGNLTLPITYQYEAGETVYWRVRGENDQGIGPLSATRNFTLEPSPLTLTRATPVAPAIPHAELNINTVTWMKPYPVGHMIPTADKRLVFLYSTDHDSEAGGIHWGVANDPKCSDFEYKGLIWDGNMSGTTGKQSETPWLVHRPEEARQWWLYFHEARINNQSGRQATRLITSSDFVTWVDEGVVMPATAEHPHTGYATVREPGFFHPTLWTAHHILGGGGLSGVSTFAMSTSPDGKQWDVLQVVDKMNHLPDGMDMGPHPLEFVEIEGQRYGFAFERVPGEQGHALMIFRVSEDGTGFLFPRYKVMDQTTITSASVYTEAGKLYVYYTLNKFGLYLAEGEVDKDSFVVGRLSAAGSFTYKAPALPGSYRIRAVGKRTEGEDLEHTVDVEVV